VYRSAEGVSQAQYCSNVTVSSENSPVSNCWILQIWITVNNTRLLSRGVGKKFFITFANTYIVPFSSPLFWLFIQQLVRSKNPGHFYILGWETGLTACLWRESRLNGGLPHLSGKPVLICLNQEAAGEGKQGRIGLNENYVSPAGSWEWATTREVYKGATRIGVMGTVCELGGYVG
jgi:hypothetical protein